MIVDKMELAAALGWSRPRLDRRLKTDRRFPVKKRGDQGHGWRFDLNAVRAYLIDGDSTGTPSMSVPAEPDGTETPRISSADLDRIGSLLKASGAKIAAIDIWPNAIRVITTDGRELLQDASAGGDGPAEV